MIFKKCTGCKREFSKEEYVEIQAQQKKPGDRLKKDVCPFCRENLKTYDESRFQKKWYGYLNSDKRMVDHLVLVEFHYYNDDSFEVKVPLLELAFETKDFSEAFNRPDSNICIYLRDKHNRTYSPEQKFFTQAYIKEHIPEKRDIAIWW